MVTIIMLEINYSRTQLERERERKTEKTVFAKRSFP
jgi:hypothetical protein